MSGEDEVRELAEVKAYLERRIEEHTRELNALKSLVIWVDKILAEKSFKKVQVPSRLEAPRPEEPGIPSEVKSTPIMTAEGVKLADLIVEDGSFRVVPVGNISFDAKLPPVESFLIRRVLEPMKNKSSKEVPEGEAFSYQIRTRNGDLSEIIVRNYGGERRLAELRSAIQWTLRRMYEKASGKTKS